MEINKGQYNLSEDDETLISHMLTLGMIEDGQSFDLRSLARAWYERGYFDRMDEEDSA